MATVLDKEIVKEALWELIVEEPETFKSMLRDVFEKAKIDDEFERLLQYNFKRFDDTFKALA